MAKPLLSVTVGREFSPRLELEAPNTLEPLSGKNIADAANADPICKNLRRFISLECLFFSMLFFLIVFIQKPFTHVGILPSVRKLRITSIPTCHSNTHMSLSESVLVICQVIIDLSYT